MTARSIGELLSGLEPEKRARTFQPVRRNSYHRGEREQLLWRPIGKDKRSAKRLIGARLKAARQYEHHHRRKIQRKHPGRRNGPLGDIGLLVLEALYDLVDFKTGRLDPAIDTIAARICKARSAVVRALARLREHGFIKWIRRSEPIENEGAGPQVRQISNAYGFGMPAEAAAWVERSLGNGPLPDDEVSRCESHEAELKAMLGQASLVEVVDYHTDDPLLAGILKRMSSGPFLD
ncbi:MAG TPA: hypothetical protein VFO12_04725 [Sphingomicrobium sp.]|nr:hypothetical protein [Sphingomicrobium sp.]